MTRRRSCRWANAGFTLIEMVVVIAISGVVAATVAMFLLRPIQGYEAQVSRAELVDVAESSLRRVARDIRRALPNSVRIDGTSKIIEMLNTLDGARYREGPGQVAAGHSHAANAFRLKTNGADNDGFNVLGFFQNITVPFDSTTERLAIYNQGVTNADAYADASAVGGAIVMTNPAVTTFRIRNDGTQDATAFNDEHQIIPLTGSFHFRWRSPNQRVYIVDMPITYICNTSTGELRRYASYSIAATQPTDPTIAPLSGVTSALVANHVSACTLTYVAGVAQRSGVVTLDLTLRDSATGEQVRLLEQVHVDNAP
ncbi:MAG: type II secretion system protein [Gammaproteobacteria bacterium]|nr:type II secretion system protein [Gammaproteobacteria bacterium]